MKLSLLKKESTTLDHNRVKEEHLQNDHVARLFGPYISIQTWSDTLRSTDSLLSGLTYWKKESIGHTSLETVCKAIPFALPILARASSNEVPVPIHDQTFFNQNAELALWIAPENAELAAYQLEALGWTLAQDQLNSTSTQRLDETSQSSET